MEKQVFREIIEGGLAKIREAGALLVGGHSIEDTELKYGLSVTGTVHPDYILLNAGAAPGDVLVLTKPLGTGILSTALKGGLAGAETEKQMVEVMATLNKVAAERVSKADFAENSDLAPHCCTDITGFGLLGHLHEIAEASEVSLRVQAGDLPVLPGVIDFIDMGIIPEGAYKNKKFYRKWLVSTLDEDNPLFMLGFDPQTSGGLLFAMPPAGAARLLAELGNDKAWIIGEVLSGNAGTITVVP